MSFESLGLSAALLRAISEQGYTSPTPVQAQVIPVALEGRDLLAGAQTGTGKTAGFALPLLQRLAAMPREQDKPRRARALILTPTRELAAQVAESVRVYGRHLPLKSTAIFGGVSINPQIQHLRRGVDILIATPGRLLDHVKQRTVDLSAVEIFVLDEADRMLDMGFLPDIRRIIALLSPRRQNLLFSATFPDDIRALANKLLHDPQRIEIGQPNTAADRIAQACYLVDKGQKRGVLEWLIRSHDWQQVLVFTRTKRGANRLAEQLEHAGFGATAIHGNKSQGARTRALADFKNGEVRILVATDVAARGIDIDQLPHVVNYELPDVPEHYVHRIGRTGRAGRDGLAVSLVAPDERSSLKLIERLLGQPLERRSLDGYQPVARERDEGGGRPPTKNRPVRDNRPKDAAHDGRRARRSRAARRRHAGRQAAERR